VGKPTNRDKILASGLRVVHQRGLAGASVRDIVEAAGVPQGSFSNHFASKEAFGVEILDLYFGFTRKVFAETLNNTDLKPLRRLEAYIDANHAFLE
jgi:TetR/AcrR family transcriptional repressor of nem operon